MVHQSVQT